MINIEKLNNINTCDMENLLATWESSVRATHDFLNEEAILSLKPQVKEGINFVDNLLVVRNSNNIIIAFMGIHDFKIEMLFINNENRGNGIGKNLVKYAIKELNVDFVDVNEQNPQGLGFYKRMGFIVFKRSEFDDQGNPFPILHMKLK